MRCRGEGGNTGQKVVHGGDNVFVGGITSHNGLRVIQLLLEYLLPFRRNFPENNIEK